MSNYVKEFFEQRETTSWNCGWWRHRIMRTLLQPPGLWVPAISLRGSQGRETWMCLSLNVALTCAKLASLKIIPLAVFPCMVYCPNTKTVGMGQKDSYVEGKIQGRLSVQTPECPMEQGIIIHPDDMGKIWHYHTSYKENVSLRNGSLSLAVQGLRWAQSPVGDWDGRDGRWRNTGFYSLIPTPVKPSYWLHIELSDLINMLHFFFFFCQVKWLAGS